jgi:hypothetical protein
MNDNNEFVWDCAPNANGILQCLRMLAAEATALGLDRSQQALRNACLVLEMEARDRMPQNGAMRLAGAADGLGALGSG